MRAFLEELAEKLWAEHGRNITYVQVVLPSRRSCLYFRYYLAKIAQQNLLAPDIRSFHDFVSSLSRVQMLDHVSLLIQLYDSYKKFDRSPSHTFETFLPLGTIMLNDFMMIERNLNPKKADDFFSFLEEVKALERWAEQLGSDTAIAPGRSLKDFFAFWTYLRNTYSDFRQILADKGVAHSGLAYRYVLDHLEELLEQNQVGPTVFAGFYQLTLVEEQIIAKMVELGKATTYWDADDYYVQPAHQEAGLYLRKYMKSWLPKDYPFYQNTVTQPRDIRIIRTANVVGQAKLLGHLLQQRLTAEMEAGQWDAFRQSMNRIAILLPDENLLMPLLYSLPKWQTPQGETVEITPMVNITMGLGLSNSPLYSLVEMLFKMQQRIRRTKEGKCYFYYKDVLKVIRHPFVQAMTGHSDRQLEIQFEIESKNKVFIHPGWLCEVGGADLYSWLFADWDNRFERAIAYFYTLCEHLERQLQGPGDALHRAFLLKFFTLTKRLESVLQERKEDISLKTFRQFLFEVLRAEKVPFSGEPIAPIQVMGMLESRTLDFEEVIVLSCNEGLMPPETALDTLIPYDLRLRYQLPTQRENDASAAYTFYRLFHRSRTVTLVYTDPATSEGARDKSRFLTQLEEEFPWIETHLDPLGNWPAASQPPAIRLGKGQLWPGLPVANIAHGDILKDEKILEMIRQKLSRGVSPSALNMYLNSPKQFFHRYVLDLGEPTELEESMDAARFGDVVHGVLETLFAPWVGKRIPMEALREMSKADQIAQTLAKVVKEKMGEMETDAGKSYLQLRLAQGMLEKFMKQQVEEVAPYGSLFLIEQEQFMRRSLRLPLPTGGEALLVMTGKTDRVDCLGNQMRIVDYKTGKDDAKAYKADELSEILKGGKDKLLQLAFYHFLLLGYLAEGKLTHAPADWRTLDIQSGFYFLVNPKEGLKPYVLKSPLPPEAFEATMLQLLVSIVAHLLDPHIPLTEAPPDITWLG